MGFCDRSIHERACMHKTAPFRKRCCLCLSTSLQPANCNTGRTLYLVRYEARSPARNRNRHSHTARRPALAQNYLSIFATASNSSSTGGNIRLWQAACNFLWTASCQSVCGQDGHFQSSSQTHILGSGSMEYGARALDNHTVMSSSQRKRPDSKQRPSYYR
jgi:hypothetical protein